MAKTYARSKLANVMFTRALAKRVEGRCVTVNAVHPGAVATGIWDVAPGWMQPMVWIAKNLIMITPEKGARSIVHLATSADVEGKTGLYWQGGVISSNKLEPKEPSKLALDDELCERLWAESARLVSIQ